MDRFVTTGLDSGLAMRYKRRRGIKINFENLRLNHRNIHAHVF